MKDDGCIEDPDQLRQHVLGTYFTLRWGLGTIAVVLPLALLAVHGLNGSPQVLSSMSSAYWLLENDKWFSGRAVFVGGLCAIAAGLYLYKGYSKKENVALNLAAIAMFLVALFPMEVNCLPNDTPEDSTQFSYCFPGHNLHGPAAVAAFAFLFYVVFFRAKDSLKELKDESTRQLFRVTYRVCAMLMVAFPAAAGVLHVLRHNYSTLTFWLEASGIAAFAVYWFIKSLEMHLSSADEKALAKIGLDMPLQGVPPT